MLHQGGPDRSLTHFNAGRTGILRRVNSAAFSLLGIDVEAVTMDHWRGWFAPEVQPFVVDSALREALGAPETLTGLPLEAQDTFWLNGDATLARDRPSRSAQQKREESQPDSFLGLVTQ
jgi:hypothetical protein